MNMKVNKLGAVPFKINAKKGNPGVTHVRVHIGEFNALLTDREVRLLEECLRNALNGQDNV